MYPLTSASYQTVNTRFGFQFHKTKKRLKKKKTTTIKTTAVIFISMLVMFRNADNIPPTVTYVYTYAEPAFGTRAANSANRK